MIVLTHRNSTCFTFHKINQFHDIESRTKNLVQPQFNKMDLLKIVF